MKKKDAVYGLFDGQIVPWLRCSFTNLCNSSSSSWERGINLPRRDEGAPGLSLITWSQVYDGGNS